MYSTAVQYCCCTGVVWAKKLFLPTHHSVCHSGCCCCSRNAKQAHKKRKGSRKEGQEEELEAIPGLTGDQFSLFLDLSHYSLSPLVAYFIVLHDFSCESLYSLWIISSQMTVLEEIWNLQKRNPRWSIALSLSCIGSVFGYFIYGYLRKQPQHLLKDGHEKEFRGRRKNRSGLTSNRSSRSEDRSERSPSFSKSPSYFELAKDDCAAAPTVPAWTSLGLEQPLVIAMVGLPARGKSYLVKMIMRYLKWTGFECKVFNVGSYRRQVQFIVSALHYSILTLLPFRTLLLDWIGVCR